MSWDILIQRYSQTYATVEEIQDDATWLPLGLRSEVQAAISQTFPGTDWSDPSWGTYNSPLGSIEFSIGKSEPCESFMLHVRATEEIALGIVELCEKNYWQALDCNSGEFLDRSSDPSSGQRTWAAYLNQILGEA